MYMKELGNVTLSNSMLPYNRSIRYLVSTLGASESLAISIFLVYRFPPYILDDDLRSTYELFFPSMTYCG